MNLMLNYHPPITLPLLRTRVWILSLTFYALCSNFLVTGQSGQSILSQFSISPQPSSLYGNLILDPDSGYVYVGLMNLLYKFDSNLNVLQLVSTGPQLDNPACLTPTSFGQSTCQLYGASSDAATTQLSTNNFNQILAVDSVRGNLITCGTLFQGTCQTRPLSNIANSTLYASSNYGNFVASNNKDEPTQAFVGPGPFGDNVLYVASSMSAPNPTMWTARKYSVGTISSRYLDWPNRTFTYFQQAINSNYYGTRVALTQTAGSKPLFNYVTGFGVNGYSYFFGSFIDPISGNVSSKILQVCQQDMNFDTYTDMYLTCGSFNQIQSAVLVQPGSLLANSLGMSSTDFLAVAIFNSSASGNSAVCSFKISDIRAAFTTNIQKCSGPSAASASLLISSYYYDSSGRYCIAVPGPNIAETYCGSADVPPAPLALRNSPLTGQTPLDGTSSMLSFSATELTGIASANIDGHTTLFLGTSNGQLKKVLFDSVAGATVFESISVDANQLAINKDMILSPSNDSLYLMSANMVYKVAVSNYGQYQSCAACVGAGDPYCGWCTLQNSCLMKASCENYMLSNRWQNRLDTSAQCPSVTSVSPPQSDISQYLNITLTIPALPAPQSNERYTCVFGSSSFSSPATYTPGQLVCPTPAVKPAINLPNDFVSFNISVSISSENINFVQAPYTFYNCSQHTACSSCTVAPWGCQWCLSTNVCQQQQSTASCSRALLNAAGTCPVLSSNVEILLPSGVSKQITIMGNNFPTLMSGERGYFCVVSTSPNNPTQLPAQRTSPNSIVCSSFSYVASLTTFQLTVIWSNGYLIENSYNLTVYDCSYLAGADCSTCLSLSTNTSTIKYGCLWCSTSTCQTNQTCSGGSSLACPAPVITQITPNTGVVSGGTKLTITGTNLGSNYNQVQVNVGSTLCAVISSEYIVSKKYVCSVPSGTGSAIVQVLVKGIAVTSLPTSMIFTYQAPQLSGLTPTLGPIYGGTPLTITGSQLNTGNNISVLLAGNLCTVDPSQSNGAQIVCSSPPVPSPVNISSIVALFDGSSRSLAAVFVYTADPTVTAINPVGSFRSGGCNLTVTGSTLQSGLNPQVIFNIPTNQIASPSSRSSNQMTLISPAIPAAVPAGLYSVSFEVDSAQILNSTLNFTISEDPKFDLFPGGSKAYNGIDNIQLTGSGFSSPCVKNSIVILVDSKPCNICAENCITDTTIYCVPPADLKTSILSSEIPVKVTVGPYISASLGNLVQQTNGLTWQTWQIAIAVIGGVFIIVVIVLIAFFICMSFKSKRDCCPNPTQQH